MNDRGGKSNFVVLGAGLIMIAFGTFSGEPSADLTGVELTERLKKGPPYDDLPAAKLSKMLKRPHPGVQHPVFPPHGNAAALKKRLAPYLKMSEAELRKRIDERGSLHGDNFKMRTVAYDLALAWALTKEPIYARRALIVLYRYAEVLPQWPVSGQTRKPHRQDDRSYFHPWRNWNEGDLWTPGGWYHGDLINAAPIFKAWDLVCTSGELDKLAKELKADVRGKILDDLLYRTIKVHLQWPFSYGNMYGHRLGGLAQCGMALGDPLIVHAVVREYAKIFTIAFYYDGLIGESSPGYARQLINRLVWCSRFFKGYSDPEGYKDPIDGTHIRNFDPNLGLAGQRLARAKAAVNALSLPTGYAVALHDEAHNESKIYGPRPTKSVPRLLGGAGHAILGVGKGTEQIQAHLHFSGCYGHDHADHLNLILFAEGEELYSDGGYRTGFGDGPRLGGSGSRRWKASTAAHNTVMIDEKDLPRRPNDPPASIHGNLVFWAASDKQCMAVEADWKNRQAELYRRTIALIHLEGNRYYVFDLFRVRGGKTHDWMLHGPLHVPYTVKTTLPLKPRAGKLVEISNLRSARTKNSVAVTITAGKASCRALLAGREGTELIVGEGPAVNRKGKATFIAVRRKGGKSLFATAHEPLQGEPRVKNIEELGDQDVDAPLLVVKVSLEGNRTDYFLSTLDRQPPFAARHAANPACTLSGTFAHVVEIAGKARRATLVGSELKWRGKTIRGAAYSGQIIGVERVEKGAKRNAFLTTQALPAGKALAGATLILRYSDGRTHGYTVTGVEADGPKQAIMVREEPGVKITPNTARFLYYPGNTFKGPTSFQIVPQTVWTPGMAPRRNTLLRRGGTKAGATAVNQTPSSIPETKLKPWKGKLKAMVRRRVTAGARPRVYLRLFGVKAEAVKIMGADAKELSVRFQSGTLPVRWSRLRDADYLGLARAFFKDGAANDHVLLAVFLLANGKRDAAEDHFAQAALADSTKAAAVRQVQKSLKGR